MLALCGPSHALSIHFTFLANTPAEAQQAFETAATRWEAVLTDEVTLEITVGVQPLGNGILVSAGSRRTSFTYSNFRTALTADQSSPLDATAAAACRPDLRSAC